MRSKENRESLTYFMQRKQSQCEHRTSVFLPVSLNRRTLKRFPSGTSFFHSFLIISHQHVLLQTSYLANIIKKGRCTQRHNSLLILTKSVSYASSSFLPTHPTFYNLARGARGVYTQSHNSTNKSFLACTNDVTELSYSVMYSTALCNEIPNYKDGSDEKAHIFQCRAIHMRISDLLQNGFVTKHFSVLLRLH